MLSHHVARPICERGTDLTICSPRAGVIGHRIGSEAVSRQWSRICNDLIRRICDLYPSNFAPVCQLPQSPGCPPANAIPELKRCVEEMGFIGCNLNPDPSGGYWTDHQLTDPWRSEERRVGKECVSPCRSRL